MNSSYTRSEIEAVLRETKFEYHRVNLPYGLSTRGRDRTKTRDLIFPESFATKTVLDVGCALGFFCFEAEARGAQRVFGVEMKRTRFEQALVLRDILGSNVEFIHEDVLNIPFAEEIHYVLLLNVVHHSPEPMRLIRRMAELATEQLIIEFPTFADPKFKKHRPLCVSWICNRFPIIGVSSVQSNAVDQTFVFSPKAVQGILTDHSSLFESVRIVDSPVRGRKVAICAK